MKKRTDNTAPAVVHQPLVQLLPCPFCGSESEITDESQPDRPKSWFFAWCKNRPNCNSWLAAGSPGEVATKWNRRADEPTPEPTQPWQPAVGDVVKANPVQDMALGGQMYWRDLALQLAEVWWKCHNIGASLQHGDIDTDVSFSVCCEQHGGQCFHADTPLNAWIKAEKWLISPDRANFPAATIQPA